MDKIQLRIERIERSTRNSLLPKTQIRERERESGWWFSSIQIDENLSVVFGYLPWNADRPSEVENNAGWFEWNNGSLRCILARRRGEDIFCIFKKVSKRVSSAFFRHVYAPGKVIIHRLPLLPCNSNTMESSSTWHFCLSWNFLIIRFKLFPRNKLFPWRCRAISSRC